jgi:signal transduction histidine kinase
MLCTEPLELSFLIFTNSVPSLLYYSHVSSIVVVLIMTIFTLVKSKNNPSAIRLSLLAISFVLWSLSSLIVWVSSNSQTMIFLWSFFGIFYILTYYFAFEFVYYFLNKKIPPLFSRLFLMMTMLPIIIFSSTNLYLNGFNLDLCEALYERGNLFSLNYYNYFYFLSLFFIFVINYIAFRNYKNKSSEDKKKTLSLLIGINLFLILFFITGYISSYLESFELEQYGLFGMTFFMVFLAYLIVRFKAFNIKLLGAQALVWVMVILIGSQFLFIQSNINRILNAITFVAVSISGLILVRSVKKVDIQRELLAKANQNQESLLHFITHQVKGYLTKSRNIFDAMIAEDYGELNPKLKEVVQHGFDSDTRGVETVQSILKASDLKTGVTEFKKEKANVSAMVAEVVEFRQDLAKEKKLDLTFEIEPNIEIQVDALQIKEVFKNLITNALMYTAKGTVHVVLKRETNQVRFAVVDTGFGLSSEDKAKLFTEGGKGADSLTMNIDSTGYGLYIAKKIIQKHQGKIGAYSEGRNKGSEFFVILPL